MAAFHGGRGALKGTPPLGGPCFPLLQGVGGQALGESVVLKRGLAHLEGLAQFGFPPGTAGVAHMVSPIDRGSEALLGPGLPVRRESCMGQSLLYPCPPEVHEPCPGGQLLPHLGLGSVTGRELMTGGQRFNGLPLREHSVRDLGRRLSSRIVQVKGMEGE